MTDPVHAGLLALRSGGRWAGVLIEGASGVGKSDLALRALETGFRLVADDRVILWTSGARLFGRAPASLAGLIEARGLGVVAETALPYCEVAFVVACVDGPGGVDRNPELQWAERGGITLPLLRLWPLEPSAPAKMRRAIDHLGAGPQRAYQDGLSWRSPAASGGRLLRDQE